jgi:uncharacterized protein
MKRIVIIAVLAVVIFPGISKSALFSQDIPDRPVPPRLVNDFAGLLNSNEVNYLESKLVAFNDSTSNQIAIVTVNDLAGYEKADYAIRLIEKWGIGQKEFDNGVVILVKAKTTTSRGETFIATGKGLEGAIPDITCAEIVDYEMIPAFKNEDYYEGLNRATDVLMALARGEYSSDQYGRKGGAVKKTAPAGFFIILIIVLIALFNSGKSNHNNISKKGNLPLWILLGMMSSGRGSHDGSWGGFSGGGGFGGGGGGFGGFGGGSSGGGGAGGSW